MTSGGVAESAVPPFFFASPRLASRPHGVVRKEPDQRAQEWSALCNDHVM